MSRHWMEALGYSAGVFTTFSLVPQILRIVRLRTARDVSIEMFLLFCLGVVLWLCYGIAMRSWPIILWNAISFVLAATILVLKLRFDHNAKHEIAHPLSKEEQ